MRVSGPLSSVKMPIYCANSANCCRKKSRSIINELIGTSNYYMKNNNSNSNNGSSGQQLSNTTSQHLLTTKANKSPSTSSLIMAINQFKNSVKDMKETVLIPTRLSDLMHSLNDEEVSMSDAVGQDDLIENHLAGCNESTNPGAGSPTPPNSLSLAVNGNPSNSLVATSIRHHNLFEQYKLLDLIDKILSSDTILTIRYCIVVAFVHIQYR